MRTLKDGWRGYLRNVVPNDAGEVQIKETEAAFFAGSFVTMNLSLEAAGIEDIDEAEKAYSKLNDEIMTFAKEKANEPTN